MRRALIWSIVWIAVSVAFGLALIGLRGPTASAQFFTAWLIEKSLSVDNVFVFFLILEHFRVPERAQQRALSYGIVGAFVFRTALLIGGVALLQRLHPIIYLVMALLLWTGARTIAHSEEERVFTEGRAVQALLRHLPRMLVVVVIIELSDILFSLDSIPAALAVTSDRWVLVSSNLLAVLGLRALYFVIIGAVSQLRFLGVGVGAVLILMGLKIGVSTFISLPPAVSLISTAVVLAAAVTASLIRPATATGRGA